MTSGPPVFKFSREAYAVKVQNIAQNGDRYEIINLFSNLVGEVRDCEESIDDPKGRTIVLTFHTLDACKKALCMSGYTVGGVPLAVTSLYPLNNHRPNGQTKHSDERRNLYVLGLPFDLTKNEFTAIFSRYGTVTHSVILATVDNASRRRGFVVMSSHAEARAAVAALSRTEIKGYRIDVSWAVVQRSQGFLDGGDRGMLLSRPSSASSMTGSDDSVSDPSLMGTVDDHLTVPEAKFLAARSHISSQSATLLVSNLPTLLFSQTVDLHPLFCPFGDIKKLEILEPTHTASQPSTISVLVQYASVVSAQEAKDALQNQVYAGYAIRLEYMNQTPCSSDRGSDYSAFSSLRSSPDLKSTLNPHAPPFIFQTCPFDNASSAFNGPVQRLSQVYGDHPSIRNPTPFTKPLELSASFDNLAKSITPLSRSVALSLRRFMPKLSVCDLGNVLVMPIVPLSINGPTLHRIFLPVRCAAPPRIKSSCRALGPLMVVFKFLEDSSSENQR
ncbi:hypothetical protein NEOLEDRAFT_1211681 [Neolentinus lepideus HHB14362 ss-1]|uniref:RRM domain-containing protein n=1 Tax=Neolentinus lepideus HHB14362 ss-1 TaxID=1314782 RepID=A0A165RD20_9AGAM|nr:hypothetical protein NEOLEDRAFT_1211681 [Neolentinus lepideus HHB14362 ss-1]